MHHQIYSGDRINILPLVVACTPYPFAFGDAPKVQGVRGKHRSTPLPLYPYAPKVQGVRGDRLWIAFGCIFDAQQKKAKDRLLTPFAIGNRR